MSNRKGSNNKGSGGDGAGGDNSQDNSKKVRSGSQGFKKPSGLKLGKVTKKSTVAKSVDKLFAFEVENTPRLNRPRREKLVQPLDDMRLGEFTIDRMSHDGRGICSWNRKTLFVDGALTGERISARLVQDHSRYAEARVDKLIAASPDRIEPACAHAAECGGCQLQHLDPAQQVVLKQDAVLAQLELWGGVKPKHILPPITSLSHGYRRCARLGVVYADDVMNVKGVSYGGDQVTLGFRRRNSKQLIQIDTCTVLSPLLQRLLAPVKQWLAEMESVSAVTHVELMETEQQTAIILRHVQAISATDRIALTLLASEFHIDIYLQGSEVTQLQTPTGGDVDPRLSYKLPAFDLSLHFHPLDFIQVNSSVNEQMVAQALRLLGLTGSERVLDLFCGIGNFTLPLARQCAEVIGIEAVESMVQRGRENAARMGIVNASFMAANLSTMTAHRLNQTCGKIDAVLLDPPRDGAKEIIDKLPQLSPKRIVYVSCNPATLARDAKVLAAAGYQLDSVGVLDMFPHTAHVESMALFVHR